MRGAVLVFITQSTFMVPKVYTFVTVRRDVGPPHNLVVICWATVI